MAINLVSHKHIFTWKCLCRVCNLITQPIASLKEFPTRDLGWHTAAHVNFTSVITYLLFSCRVTLFLWPSPDSHVKGSWELVASTNHAEREHASAFSSLFFITSTISVLKSTFPPKNPPVPSQIPHSFVLSATLLSSRTHITSCRPVSEESHAWGQGNRQD